QATEAIGPTLRPPGKKAVHNVGHTMLERPSSSRHNGKLTLGAFPGRDHLGLDAADAYGLLSELSSRSNYGLPEKYVKTAAADVALQFERSRRAACVRPERGDSKATNCKREIPALPQFAILPPARTSQALDSPLCFCTLVLEGR